MENEISLDELFNEQEKVEFLATIEKIKDDDTKVKVTPWLENGGCECSNSLELPKSAIEKVKPTGKKHYCCGKSLLVCEIKFHEKASIPVSELFAQAIQSANQSSEAGLPFDYASGFPVSGEFRGKEVEGGFDNDLGIEYPSEPASYEGYMENDSFQESGHGRVGDDCTMGLLDFDPQWIIARYQG